MNFDKYINLPYKHSGRDFNGVDCYGLIWLIYKEERNIILPDHLYEYDWVEKGCNHIIEQTYIVSLNPTFKWIDKDQCNIYDGLFFYASTKRIVVNHIGLYIGEGHKFVHISARYNSRVDRLDNLWENRLYGVMRYCG